jgi:protocatechuate 3,4-dioxygenase beta subunit
MSRSTKSLLVLFSVLFLFTACHQEEISQSVISKGSRSLTISGIVTDDAGNPLSDVTVISSGRTVTTNSIGAFLIQNLTISNDIYFLKFKKNGYFSNTRSGKLATDETRLQVKVGLIPDYNATTLSFSTGTAATLLVNSSTGFSATVEFPSDITFVDKVTATPYTGVVEAKAYYLDPTEAAYNNLQSGGSRFVQSYAGLESSIAFGSLFIELKSSTGHALNIDANSPSTATLKMGIPDSLLGDSPDTVGVYSNDMDKSVETEDGHGSKQGGQYVAAVRHFSYWEAALAYSSTATVMGTVKDVNGHIVAGVRVSIGQNQAITDQYGNYRVYVPAGTPLKGLVKSNDFYGMGTAVTSIPSIAADEIDTVDFTVAALQPVSGTITDCQGHIVTALVSLTWGVGTTVQTLSTNGQFTLLVPTGESWVSIEAKSSDVTYSESIVLDGTNGRSDVNITLCPPATLNENSFTITGGAYSDSIIVLDPMYASNATGYMESIGTSISVYDPNAGISFSISTKLKDVGIGTVRNYIARGAEDDTTTISLQIDGVNMEFESGTFEITRYDTLPNGLIEGLFSGTASGVDSISYTISHGKFSVHPTH